MENYNFLSVFIAGSRIFIFTFVWVRTGRWDEPGIILNHLMLKCFCNPSHNVCMLFVKCSLHIANTAYNVQTRCIGTWTKVKTESWNMKSVICNGILMCLLSSHCLQNFVKRRFVRVVRSDFDFNVECRLQNLFIHIFAVSGGYLKNNQKFQNTFDGI